MLCPLYKLKTVWMKLHTFVKQNETICRAQEPELTCIFLDFFKNAIIRLQNCISSRS